MSDEYLLSRPEPIVAPQPATAPAWAARRWSGSAYDSSMARQHRGGFRHDRQPADGGSANGSAAFSMAEGLRSTITTLSIANAELQRSLSVLYVTRAALRCATDELATLRRLLVAPAGPGGVGLAPPMPDRFAEVLAAVRTCFSNALYGGKSLLSGNAGVYPASALAARLEAAMARPSAQQPVEINAVMQTHEQWMKTVEADMDNITNQIALNSQTIDRLSHGLGSLVDVDLHAEAARLKALQIQQQLSKSGIPLGNAVPSTLVALFR